MRFKIKLMSVKHGKYRLVKKDKKCNIMYCISKKWIKRGTDEYKRRKKPVHASNKKICLFDSVQEGRPFGWNEVIL